jgi:hypothetical protein
MRSTTFDKYRWSIRGLFLIHAILVSFCAIRYSFTATELGLLPAGIVDWQYDGFGVYRVNPPLVRMWGAIPAVVQGAEIPYRGTAGDPRQRAEWEVGREMFNTAGDRVYSWLIGARLFCLPFTLAGMWVAVRWSEQLYGRAGAVGAAVLWTFFPSFLGYGCLISGDAQAASMGLVTFYLFRSWLRRADMGTAYLLGLAAGLTMLTKTSWLILLGLLPAMWLLIRLAEWLRGEPDVERAADNDSLPHHTLSPAILAAQGMGEGTTESSGRRECHSPLHQLGSLAVVVALSVVIVNLLYGFGGSFRRLGSYDFISQSLAGSEGWEAAGWSGNRFRGTILENVPVPFPESLVIGVDLQKWDFDRERWSYFRGQWRTAGWWYYYVYGLAVKLPLGFWILFTTGACALIVWRSWRCPLRDELLLWLTPLLIIVAASLETGLNRHLRYTMPALPFLLVLACRAFRVFHEPLPKTRIAVVVATAWAVTSSLWMYPHSLSYFNELIGGPLRADRHFNASNLDWGQDLKYLGRWQQARPDARPLWVTRWQEIQSMEAAGVEASGEVPRMPQDVRSPTRSHRDADGPRFPTGWYAIDRESLLDRSGHHEYLRSMVPSARAGYAFVIFEITPEKAAELERQADDISNRRSELRQNTTH